MPKHTQFRNIPPYTSYGRYAVNTSIRDLERTLLRYDKEYGLEMDPPFQRAHVWTEQQQIRYIEHILKYGAISGKDIWWNCPGWMGNGRCGKLVLVDGKQRLSALLLFLRNYIPAYGSFYREYEDQLDRVNYDLIFHINDLKTDAEVYQWYIDMNAGGVTHTDEEIEKVRDMLERTKTGVLVTGAPASGT